MQIFNDFKERFNIFSGHSWNLRPTKKYINIW